MSWIKVKNSSIPNCILVECVAEIKNNETGEIREYETHGILNIHDKYPSTFIWEKGNYSCDCNRRLFFKDAHDERTEEDWDAECSSGKFSVNLKNKKDGKVYYCEYDSNEISTNAT